MIKMISKYTNKCSKCHEGIQVGESIYWNKDSKYVMHAACFEKKKRIRAERPRRTSMTYPFSGSHRNGRRK